MICLSGALARSETGQSELDIQLSAGLRPAESATCPFSAYRMD